MNPRLVAAAMLFVLPGAAAADQTAICQSLYRRLASVPTIIGNTAEVRRKADALREIDDEIRYLRTEMRRTGCGSGSIVTYGRSNDVCFEITDALRQAQADRETIRSQQGSRSLVRPDGERNAIIAAIEANQCRDIATMPLSATVDPQTDTSTVTVPNVPSQSGSSITTISPKEQPAPQAAAAPPPPPPERPYDPSGNVRSVGPTFLPDDSAIDLANPAADGAQSRQ
ncbi:MAG: hypothetical protein ACK4N1_15295 [Pseudorhizobium sp.]